MVPKMRAEKKISINLKQQIIKQRNNGVKVSEPV